MNIRAPCKWWSRHRFADRFLKRCVFIDMYSGFKIYGLRFRFSANIWYSGIYMMYYSGPLQLISLRISGDGSYLNANKRGNFEKWETGRERGRKSDSVCVCARESVCNIPMYCVFWGFGFGVNIWALIYIHKLKPLDLRSIWAWYYNSHCVMPTYCIWVFGIEVSGCSERESYCNIRMLV